MIEKERFENKNTPHKFIKLRIGNCPFVLVAFKTDMTLFDSVLNNKNELDIFSINSNSNRLSLFRLSEIDF